MPLTPSLPDVNVLLALLAAGHAHHIPARQWFEGREPDSVAICRVTQMGLLRLLTNAKVFSSDAHSVEQAWNISNDVLADRRVFFEYEPPDLETEWRAMMSHRSVGPSSWTDAFLAAFSKQYGYEMVTFDHGFRRWNNLNLTVLGQAGK